MGFLFLTSLGLFLLFASLDVSIFGSIFGAYLLLVGLNYLPLLLYAITISRKKIAQVEAQKELQRKDKTRKQSIQQLIILVPFLFLILAVMQEMETRKN